MVINLKSWIVAPVFVPKPLTRHVNLTEGLGMRFIHTAGWQNGSMSRGIGGRWTIVWKAAFRAR
ncbi:MAG: hypothetical protein ABI306_05480 [Caulobacteraceae bacterium]